eukprot:jgi/Antlo1/2497/1689
MEKMIEIIKTQKKVLVGPRKMKKTRRKTQKVLANNKIMVKMKL